MSWQTRGTSFTNPAYYRDAADSVEAQLRADFAAHHQLGEIAAYGETPAQVVEYKARAHAIARHWQQDASPEHQQLWHHLASAVQAWTANPEAARVEFGKLQQSFIDGDPDIDLNSVRTQRQAAELTGHLEPVDDRSAQDGARWRPRHLSVVPDPGVEATHSDSLVDRALGGHAAVELSMAEVEAIINGSDELLAAEEALGDLDTGEDEITALLPAAQRNAYLTPTVTIDQLPAQIGAVSRVQDLAAQHARLATKFDESSEGSQVRIDQLERLMDGARDARRAAALAGADHAEITAAYQAGLAGHYWSQQPGAPRLAQLEHVLGDRDHAMAELDTLRSQLGLVPGHPPALALAAGVENTHHPASNTTPPGGAVIASAVEAALPEADPAADWASPELTGVIDAPRHAPGVDPHF
ncbi:hypothetical protein IU487_14140 [Nocardia puris]|uniref:hypothetical protein n=1 Tax=Nocardia puris TaxID=208602 RepID=UPI0018931006|nr:hypothetical protein [Nocardia puris]MBF6212174.1 hypothetical protein [Nocardia puris]